MTAEDSQPGHSLSKLTVTAPLEPSQDREGLNVTMGSSGPSEPGSGDPIVASDVWAVAGWTIQFVRLGAQQTLDLEGAAAKTYVKVVEGRLTQPDRAPFAAARAVRGTEVNDDHLQAADEGALFAVLTRTTDAPDSIRSMDQLVFSGPQDEVFHWQRFADKFGQFTDAFDGADAHIVPGFHLLDAAGAEIAYVHFWTAGKGVDLTTHNHANNPSPVAPAFAEVHWVFNNGTGSGGMYECDEPGAPNRERYPMQSGDEHGAFFVRDPATGLAKLRENGAVEYPWHGWQAGTNDDEGQAFDFVAAFEINPRVA